MYQLPRTLFDRLPSTGVERGICISNFPSTSKASATQPLGLFAFDSCIITNTAGQAQLMGKPADTPDAVIANAVKQSIATTTTTDQVQANSGAIANNFDKDAVQSEIDLQIKVTQQFDTTRQQAKTIVNQQIDGLNKTLKDAEAALKINPDDPVAQQKYKNTQASINKWQIGGTIIDSIASGLSGPSSTGAAGILANAAAPQLQYQIGQYFKGTDAEGSTAHILAHTILAAAVAAAGGNDALMAGLAAGGAEAVAPAVANWLFGSNLDVKKDAKGNVIASELTAEQNNILSNIIGLGTAGVTGLASGSVTDVVSSTGLAQTAVEDNYLTKYQHLAFVKELQAAGLFGNKDEVLKKYQKISAENDIAMAKACDTNPNSTTCAKHVELALDYGTFASSYLGADVKRSNYNALNLLFNELPKQTFTNLINNIDKRADLFDAMANQVPNSRWFQGAADVSRACFIGLGADGCGSWATFWIGTLGQDKFYQWREEAGKAIMQSGYDYFKNSFNNSGSYSVADDIAQLKREQQMLQRIHEKYLGDEKVYRGAGRTLTYVLDGYAVNLLDYNSRVEYGCKKMGFTSAQGCKP